MYNSATRQDLWQALTEQAREEGFWGSDMSVQTVMDTWTLQTGFPLVTVTRNYDEKTATITQVYLLQKPMSILNKQNIKMVLKSIGLLYFIIILFNLRQALRMVNMKW